MILLFLLHFSTIKVDFENFLWFLSSAQNYKHMSWAFDFSLNTVKGANRGPQKSLTWNRYCKPRAPYLQFFPRIGQQKNAYIDKKLNRIVK